MKEYVKDVTFDEDTTLKKVPTRRNIWIIVSPIAVEPMKEVAPSPNDEIMKKLDMLEPQEPPHMNISHKRNPSWSHDIIQEEERYGSLEGSTR